MSNYIFDSFRRTILEEKTGAAFEPLFVMRERKNKRDAPMYAQKSVLGLVGNDGKHLDSKSILELLVGENEDDIHSVRMSMVSNLRITTELNTVPFDRADSLVIALPFYSVIKSSMES